MVFLLKVWFVMKLIKTKIIIGLARTRLKQKMEKKFFYKKQSKQKSDCRTIRIYVKIKNKNTIEPEIIIENYGADAVRLFILSDSPPEKRCAMVRTRNDSFHINLSKNFGCCM